MSKRLALLPLLTACLAAGLTADASAARSGVRYHHSVTAQPLGMIFSIGNLEYERVLTPETAGAVRLDFFSRAVGDWDASGIGAGASYRHFPMRRKSAPEGLWFGPGADVLFVGGAYGGEEGAALFMTIFGEIGYKWILGEDPAFVVSPFAALGYIAGDLRLGDIRLPFGGMNFGLGVSLGVAF